MIKQSHSVFHVLITFLVALSQGYASDYARLAEFRDFLENPPSIQAIRFTRCFSELHKVATNQIVFPETTFEGSWSSNSFLFYNVSRESGGGLPEKLLAASGYYPNYFWSFDGRVIIRYFDLPNELAERFASCNGMPPGEYQLLTIINLGIVNLTKGSLKWTGPTHFRGNAYGKEVFSGYITNLDLFGPEKLVYAIPSRGVFEISYSYWTNVLVPHFFPSLITIRPPSGMSVEYQVAKLLVSSNQFQMADPGVLFPRAASMMFTNKHYSIFQDGKWSDIPASTSESTASTRKPIVLLVLLALLVVPFFAFKHRIDSKTKL